MQCSAVQCSAVQCSYMQCSDPEWEFSPLWTLDEWGPGPRAWILLIPSLLDKTQFQFMDKSQSSHGTWLGLAFPFLHWQQSPSVSLGRCRGGPGRAAGRSCVNLNRAKNIFRRKHSQNQKLELSFFQHKWVVLYLPSENMTTRKIQLVPNMFLFANVKHMLFHFEDSEKCK